MVVEDEPLLRIMAVDLVEDAGFVALEAADGDEAIGILEARSDIRIIFTDIQMPGSMNGMGLAACVRHRWPPIEIIVTSGDHAGADVLLPRGGVFVPKPYDHERMMELMHRLMH